MSEVIVITNQKGGVGKTVTSKNLGYALGKLNKKVLVIDFDPQANLTATFVNNSNEEKKNVTDLMNLLLEEKELPNKKDYIKKYDKLDLIGTDIGLSVVESNLRFEMGSEELLKRIIEEVRNDYDYILIDTSPSLSNLTINALVSANKVIIPVSTEFYSLMGLNDLLQTIAKVKKRLNKNIDISGIVLTMCHMNTNLYKEMKEEIKKWYGSDINIFSTDIPRSVKVGEANCKGISVIEYNKKSKVAFAYMELAKELVGVVC